jgi:hypothetical protein
MRVNIDFQMTSSSTEHPLNTLMGGSSWDNAPDNCPKAIPTGQLSPWSFPGGAIVLRLGEEQLYSWRNCPRTMGGIHAVPPAHVLPLPRLPKITSHQFNQAACSEVTFQYPGNQVPAIFWPRKTFILSHACQKISPHSVIVKV